MSGRNLSTVIGKPYTMDILLTLFASETDPICKVEIVKEMNIKSTKTVWKRFDDLESAGLIEVDNEPRVSNRKYIRLTWYGRKIARNLQECVYLYEMMNA